jgi:hypothetical protein
MAKGLYLIGRVSKSVLLSVRFQLPALGNLVHVPLHLVSRRGADLFAECIKAVS